MANLDNKLKKIFPNLVVNKKYAIRTHIKRLPRFISEYFVMMFTKDDKLEEDMLYKFLKRYYVTPEERNKVLFELKKEGKKEIIDEFYIEMRIVKSTKEGTSIASDIVPGLKIPSLMIDNAWIKESIMNENLDLLRGGIWGKGTLEMSRKVLVTNISLIDFPDIFNQDMFTNISSLFKELFFSKLEECGFKVEVIDTKNPVFVSNLRDILSKFRIYLEEPSINQENLNDKILVSLAYEMLANYIFKPYLIYKKDESRMIFQIYYFSLIEKKWKNFEFKSKQKVELSYINDEVENFFTICIVKFLEEEKITPCPFITLTEFKPYQISSIFLEIIISNRKMFNTEEWKNIIIKSIGLEPQNYSQRQKLLFLVRLVPFVENNVNLIEVGPKATGKTYIYRNASLYTRIFAGGKISPAQIFYHGTHKIPGEIIRRDCIVFDELSKIEFPEEMISKLKDYMVDGYFERLALKRAHSECGLVFIDNMNSMDEIMFNTSISIFSDTAFLDRIHALIPGWELPKIEQAEKHLNIGYGLASDVLCEFFHQMRDKNFLEIIDERIELIGKKITIRDEKGIKKIASGLLKIIFPDHNFSNGELLDIMELAIELRQNINKILHTIEPNEFPLRKIECKLKK